MTSKNPLPHKSELVYQKLKGFKIGLNIASIVKHIEELRIFINERPFDILCIETQLDNTVYLRNNISYVERSDLISGRVEALCLKIRKRKSKPTQDNQLFSNSFKY